MKAKFTALDMKRRAGVVGGGLLLVLLIVHFLILSPKKSEATELRTQVEDIQLQIDTAKLQKANGGEKESVDTASVFRLVKAVPDRDDMPGVVLALVEVARDSGVEYELLEPQDRIKIPGGILDARMLHLVVRGNFSTLSSFIGRLQGLVTLQNGELEARGRLFNVERVDLARDQTGVAAMRADISLKAYIYKTPVAAADEAVVEGEGTETAVPPATGEAG